MQIERIEQLSAVPQSRYAVMLATLERLEVNGCMAVECDSMFDKRLVRMRLYTASSELGMSVRTQSIGLRLEVQRIK